MPVTTCRQAALALQLQNTSTPTSLPSTPSTSELTDPDKMLTPPREDTPCSSAPPENPPNDQEDHLDEDGQPHDECAMSPAPNCVVYPINDTMTQILQVLAQNQSALLEQQSSQEESRLSIKLADPFKFNGHDCTHLDPWFFQLKLLFCASPQQYHSDVSKVSCTISWLSETVQGHFANLMESGDDDFMSDWSLFETELHTHFGSEDPIFEAKSAIDKLTMADNQQILAYDLEFNKHVPHSSINDGMLNYFYFKGLPERLKDEIMCDGCPSTLAAIQQKAQCTNQCYWE